MAFGSLLFALSARLQAGQYFQDFTSAGVGTTSFGDGSTLTSTHLGTVAAVQGGAFQELQLTASGTGGTRSAFRLPGLGPGQIIYAFSAKWNSQVWEFPSAADGFSFNFGQLASLDLTNALYAQESGYGTGICFSVQTYAGCVRLPGHACGWGPAPP